MLGATEVWGFFCLENRELLVATFFFLLSINKLRMKEIVLHDSGLREKKNQSHKDQVELQAEQGCLPSRINCFLKETQSQRLSTSKLLSTK